MTPETLLHLRKERMLTRDELAAELGCSASAIVHWEGGARVIPDWVAEKMYRTLPLEFTVDELAELYDMARELNIGLHALFAKSLRPMIEDRIRAREQAAKPKVKFTEGGSALPDNNRRLADDHGKDEEHP
jgi:DNA-binding XRE family transcriptional regulator